MTPTKPDLIDTAVKTKQIISLVKQLATSFLDFDTHFPRQENAYTQLSLY